MTVRQKQTLFVKCLGELIRYAGEQGYELTLGEGKVYTPRKGEVTKEIPCPHCSKMFTYTFQGFFDDRVHMEGSLHYSALAIDLNLFINGRYVEDGADPAWANLGQFWEGLDPQCRWGGRFKSKDSNHFSIAHSGRA